MYKIFHFMCDISISYICKMIGPLISKLYNSTYIKIFKIFFLVRVPVLPVLGLPLE